MKQASVHADTHISSEGGRHPHAFLKQALSRCQKMSINDSFIKIWCILQDEGRHRQSHSAVLRRHFTMVTSPMTSTT